MDALLAGAGHFWLTSSNSLVTLGRHYELAALSGFAELILSSA